MKRNVFLIILLLALAFFDGWMLSRITWMGRWGINLFHKDYQFLKSWYFNVAIVFGTWILLFLLHQFIRRVMPFATGRVMHILLMLASLACLYIFYADFRHDMSHRLMGEKFHIGAYIYCLGWTIIAIFFASAPPRLKKEVKRL